MKPNGDICAGCGNAFEPHTRRGECMSTNLCHTCCVESDRTCVDQCAQALSLVADDDAFDYAASVA